MVLIENNNKTTEISLEILNVKAKFPTAHGTDYIKYNYTVCDADRTSCVIPITIQTDHLCQLNDLFVHKCTYVVI